jgi:thiamine kinase-like enzyme
MIILDFELNGIDNEEVAKVIREVRPNWNLNELKSKCYSHSMTNTVSHFFINSREDDDSIVVRVNGEAAFLDRKKELEAFERLSEAGIADELLAHFKNGLVMKPIKGSTLHRDTVKDKKVSALVAKAMAQMHKNTKLLPTETGQALVKTMNQFVSMIPDKYSDAQKEAARRKIQLPETSELKKLIEESSEALANQTTPLVVCHNDLLLNNFLHDEITSSMKIIDYEYLAPNPAAFDIANHFNEFVGTDDFGPDDYLKYLPDDFFIRWWLIEYLREFLAREPTEKELISWERSVKDMMPLSHYFWASWSMVQVEASVLDFDYVNYAKLRFDEAARLVQLRREK